MNDLFPTLSAVDRVSDVSSDEVLRVLAEADARTVLAYVSIHPEATLEDLATVVVGTEAADDHRVGTPEDHSRARIRLHHAILPWLDDCGFLSYSAEMGRVSDVDVPDPIRSLLEVEANDDAS